MFVRAQNKYEGEARSRVSRQQSLFVQAHVHVQISNVLPSVFARFPIIHTLHCRTSVGDGNLSRGASNCLRWARFGLPDN